MDFKDVHGNTPDHMKRVNPCIYFIENDGCSHNMNHGGCDDSEFCMVAVYRKFAGQENVNPCGLLTGDSCIGSDSIGSSFAGCGNPYCIHFKTKNWRGRP